MNRRHVLKSLPALGSLALAGCSSVLGSGESGAVLGKIEIINSSFVSNRVRVIVERGDETLVERDISLASIDADDDAGWALIEPSWSQTRAQYTIRAVHIDESGDPETEHREYTFTQEDYSTYYEETPEDPGCIGASIKIGSLADDENAGIGISPTYMENPCENSDSQ